MAGMAVNHRVKTKYGVSLTEISRKTGLEPAHVSKILSGRGVRLKNAVAVAAAMGISLDQFYRRFYSRDSVAA